MSASPVFPLSSEVVVHPYDIEEIRPPPEIHPTEAAKHVPGLPLVSGELGSLGGEFGRITRSIPATRFNAWMPLTSFP
jgi:hypothetical protein